MTCDSIEQNFNFSAEINQSFLDYSFQFYEFDSNEHAFNNASQLVDIDLIDYCDISSDRNQGNNLTLIDSYFRQKSSSLQNLNFSVKHNAPLVDQKCIHNSKLIQNNYFIDYPKSLSFTNLTQNLTSISTSSQSKSKSVYFSIARYSRFEFNFINLRNLNDYGMLICFKFVIDKKLKNYLFEIQKENLMLLPKLEQRENLAYLIPYESGKYLIRCCCLSLSKNRKIAPILINCYLDVAELTISRPFSNQKIIELNCFEGIQSEQHDFFFRLSKPRLDRHFVLKLCLESQSALVKFAGSFNSISENIKYHLVNPWKCLLCFVRPNDFNIKIQIENHSKIQNSSQLLSIYACDSIKEDKFFLLNDYRININFCQRNELEHSCIQTYFSDGHNQMTLSKWKRIDFRNKDQLKRVKVNIHLRFGGKEVAQSNWKCTQTEFIIEPLTKKIVFVCLNNLFIENTRKCEDARTPLPYISLLVDQFAGKGKVVTSVVHLTVME